MHLGLAQLGLLAMAVFAVFIAVVIALVYPYLRPRLARLAPAQRSRLLATLCVLPAIGAGGLTMACFFPSVVTATWPSPDHCPDHALGHPHLCLVHPPDFSGSVLSWAIIGAFGAYIFVFGIRYLARLRRQRRALLQLERTAKPLGAQGVWVVETDAPFAWTTGVWRQQTLVTKGLLGSLTGEHVSAVIEHERAHERRHDVLVRMLAALFSFAHLPEVRRQLLTDLELATEQACDEEAGMRMGDRFLVARALVGLERALHGSQLTFGLAEASIQGSSVAQRVESLLADPVPSTFNHSAERWVAVAIASALLLLANPLHHLTETILGLFAR